MRIVLNEDPPLCMGVAEAIGGSDGDAFSSSKEGPEIDLSHDAHIQSVDWTSRSAEEIQELESEATLSKIEASIGRSRTAVPASIIWETAEVDLHSADRRKLTFIRYRRPEWHRWNCIVEDGLPSKFVDRFNRYVSDVARSPYNNNCSLLISKNETYILSVIGSYGIGLYTPKKIVQDSRNTSVDLDILTVCSFVR